MVGGVCSELLLESLNIVSDAVLHCCHISLFCAGVEVLNNAIETLHSSVSVEKWIHVNVTVAPSSITISNHDVGCYYLN